MFSKMMENLKGPRNSLIFSSVINETDLAVILLAFRCLGWQLKSKVRISVTKMKRC